MNASLDVNCKTIMDKSCSNENYLTDYEKSFWLLNASVTNPDKGYFVSAGNSLNEKNLRIDGYARPTFYISANTTYSSGSGTINDPYIIK